jgi:D-alanyl-D-alanine endopeptidase (penicillin-binding protein 7)
MKHKENFSHTNPYTPLIIALIFFALVLALVVPSFQNSKKTSLEASATLSSIALRDFDFSHSPFESVVLNADIAYVRNIETEKVVFHKNADLVSPLASLAKLVTAYTALEILDREYEVVIQESDLVAVGDHGLLVGERWKLEDLVVFMLITSSNDSALAIERTANEYLKNNSSTETFLSLMNSTVQNLGFETLSFKNTSGLDLNSANVDPSAIGSAQDISLFFLHAYKTYPDIFTATSQSRSTFQTDIKTHNVENTNILLGFSRSQATGSKTGYTRTAGGNLVIISPIQGQMHIITVLKSTRDGRFSDVEELLQTLD